MKKRLSLYWFWMPIVHCLLLILGYFVFYALIEPLGGDWGGLAYVLFFFALYMIVIAPLMAFFYCKKINARGVGWKKYLYCLYNSVIMGMYYIVCTMPFNNLPIDLKYVMAAVISAPGLAVLIPSLICGAVTLIVYDARTLLSNDNNNIA